MTKEINQIIKTLMLPADYAVQKTTAHQESDGFIKWQNEVYKKLEGKNPVIIGIPYDTSSAHRGAALGTHYLRKYINSIEPSEDLIDLGDVKIIPHFIHDRYLNEETKSHFKKEFFNEENLPISPLSVTEKVCEEIYHFHPTKKIFALGGDNSISYPLIKTWFKSKKDLGIKTAIIHFDSSSNLKPDNIGLELSNKSWVFELNKTIVLTNELIQIGIQEKDENASFCTQYTSSYTKNNLSQVLKGITEYIEINNVEEVYISFDISCLDKNYASCTSDITHHGLEPHHCTYLIRGIAQAANVTGCDLVEVAPKINNPNQNPLSSEPNTTLNNSALIANALIEVLNNGR